MTKIMYRFTCKNCGHEYVGDIPEMKCPKCGTLNQSNGTFTPTK